MLNSLRHLWRLLTAEQRRRLARLQILVVLLAFAEIVSVLSIVPFMTAVGDAAQLEGTGPLARAYAATGLADPAHFLLLLGSGVLVLLAVASLFSMLTLWRLLLYANQIGAELSSRLYRHYLHQPWLFHAAHNSSELTSRIAQEAQRVTAQLIVPLMQINARAVVAAALLVGLFVYNPWVALIGLGLFSAAYALLYRVVRRQLVANGAAVSRHQQARFRLMNEGFGGAKDVLLLHRQAQFTAPFEAHSRAFGRAVGTTQALSQVPRYAMELLAFGAVIALILYLLAAHQGQLGSILPILSVYALAGFKLLPAFQQIYQGISTVRGNLAAFECLQADFEASREAPPAMGPAAQPPAPIAFERDIELRDIRFRYPAAEADCLHRLHLHIPRNAVVGLVGASGSGKSTTVDVLLGLLRPQAGALYIDGRALTDADIPAWQQRVGYVAQSIFLADRSIRENVAFGLAPDDIDEQRVRRALQLAHLHDFVAGLPQGLDTEVGERGVQLSAGQRQRRRRIEARQFACKHAPAALDFLFQRIVMPFVVAWRGLGVGFRPCGRAYRDVNMVVVTARVLFRQSNGSRYAHVDCFSSIRHTRMPLYQGHRT